MILNGLTYTPPTTPPAVFPSERSPDGDFDAPCPGCGREVLWMSTKVNGGSATTVDVVDHECGAA